MAANREFWQLLVDKKGEWRAYFVAKNGKTIFATSESYINKADCLHAIDIVEISIRNTVLFEGEVDSQLERKMPSYDFNGNPVN